MDVSAGLWMSVLGVGCCRNRAAGRKLLIHMHIVFLDHNYSTENVGSGARCHGFASRLAARGHQVSVITSDRCLTSVLPMGGELVHRFNADGVAVSVIHVGLARPSSFLRRLRSHLVFAFVSLWQLLWMRRLDVVYAVSPPLTVVLPAIGARWLRRVRFILEVRELMPDVLIGIGSLRSRLLIRMLSWLERMAYRRASRIVTLAEGVAHHIGADLRLAEKIRTVPHSCDVASLGGGDGTQIRADNGWTGKFVCLHAGPMVRANGLEAIIRIADVLREDEQFVFWLVGDGDHREPLERNIRDRGLTNVVIWGTPSDETMRDVLAAADLCLVTIGPYPILEQGPGDRLFDYLAAGKPVLLNYGGWQRELVERYGAGLGTDLGHYEQFYQRIGDFCDHVDRRQEMTQHAREFAQNEYQFDRVFQGFEKVLYEMVWV